jgi:hypothetical protein
LIIAPIVCHRCGVSDTDSRTGRKFAAGVVDTGGNFFAGVVDTGGKFATGSYWWCTLNCKYLREFSKKIEMVLMEYSGAGGKLIHEKTRSKKSHDTVPLMVPKFEILI